LDPRGLKSRRWRVTPQIAIVALIISRFDAERGPEDRDFFWIKP